MRRFRYRPRHRVGGTSLHRLAPKTCSTVFSPNRYGARDHGCCTNGGELRVPIGTAACSTLAEVVLNLLLFNELERLVVMVNYIAKRVPRYIFFGYDETDAIHISDSRLRRSSLRREENLIPCTTVRHTDSRANETPRRKWATVVINHAGDSSEA